MTKTKTRSSLTLAILSLLLSPAAVFLSGLPARSQLASDALVNEVPAQWGVDASFQPSGGKPGGREGAATRSPCVLGRAKLTALAPQNELGLTADPYPSFFAYIPKTRAEKVRFTLETEDGKEVYTSSFDLAKLPGKDIGQPGIAHLKLPKNAGFTPLEIGTNYRWRYTLVCDGGATIFARGWVRRVEPDADLTKALETATLSEQIALYADANLWHDTLAAVNELHLQKPRDRSVANVLVKLLKAVELEGIAEAVQSSQSPWLDCCNES